MVRKYFGQSLLMMACSVGLLTPVLAAAGSAGNPTESASAANLASGTTANATAPSTTSTSTISQATVPTVPTTNAASPVPQTTSTSTASTTSTSTSNSSSTSNASTSTSAPAASTQPATPSGSTDAKATQKPSMGNWPSSWVTKKDEPVDTTNYKQTYKNAVHSECISIAEYLGYQKNPDVKFNQPIQADYKIVRILKGPPLNKRLPIKYEFHDHSNPPTPPGWKFSEKEMPAVGSQWLIFIEHAVPHNGQFETYEGNWGRQPASEDNLNKVYELLQNQGETGY